MQDWIASKGEILHRLLMVILPAFLVSAPFAARADEYIVTSTHEQRHSDRENLGMGDADKIVLSYFPYWYSVENPDDKEWNVTLTHPRQATGWVPASAPDMPENPYEFEFTGWAGIIHNGQKFYLSEFVYPYSDDYNAFASAVVIVLNPGIYDMDNTLRMTRVTKIGDYAYAGSNVEYFDVALNTDIIPDGENHDVEIGDYAFAYSTRYKGIPEGSPYRLLPECVKKLGKGVFKGCTAMERMIVGDGIEVLPEETFDGCTSLRELKLGAGIKRVDCSVTSLKRLAVAAPQPPEIAPGCTLEAEEVWVPAQYADAYRAAWPDKNIKPYSFTFASAVVEAYAGYQAEVHFERKSPGEGVNNYVYCYPRGKTTDGKQNIIWTVDSVHGSDAPDGKMKTVWYSYSCDQPTMLAAGNVVYEDQALVRFDVPGTYKLYFTTLDITDHTEEVTVHVNNGKPGEVYPDKITLKSDGPQDHSMIVGGSIQLTAEVSNSTFGKVTDSSIRWSTSDYRVATVDYDGKITGVAPGFATITATGAGNFPAKTTYNVEVYQPIERYVLERQSGDGWKTLADGNNYVLHMPVGEAMRIRPHCYPEGVAYEKMYISRDLYNKPANKDLAEVEIDEDNGYFRILSAGYVQLNVSVKGRGYQREVPVKIYCVDPAPVTEIELYEDRGYGDIVIDESEGLSGSTGELIRLSLDYNYDAGEKRVVWSSSNPAVAEVDMPGGMARAAGAADDGIAQTSAMLKLKSIGTTTITATATDGSGVKSSIEVNVATQLAKVTVKQTAAINNQTLSTKEYENDMYFLLSDDGTATLTYPRQGDEVRGSYPATPYDFSFVGYYAIRMPFAYDKVWRPLADEVNFKYKDAIFTALRVPETITFEGKEYTVTAIGEYAFAGSNVKYLHVPSSVTSIGDYAFMNDTSFVGINRVSEHRVIPNSVAILGRGLFKGCINLQRMIIGTGVTRVPEETFDGCDKLSSLEIGGNVEEIACRIAPLGYLVMNPVKPPKLEQGGTIDVTAASVWSAPEAVDAYSALLSPKIANGYNVEFTVPKAVYTGKNAAIKWKSMRTPESGVCAYSHLYPEDVNGQPGVNFTARSAWFSLDFDDVSMVETATDVKDNTSVWNVSFRKPGVCNITARALAATEMVRKMSITVLPGNPIEALRVAEIEKYMELGTTAQLNVTIYPADAADPGFEWKFSKEGIVEVDENGVLKAVGTGTVKITAESTDPYCTTRTSNALEITVIKTVNSVELTADGETIGAAGISGYPGDKIKLSVNFEPSDAYPETCGWTMTSAIGALTGENETVELELKSPGRGLASFFLTQKTGKTSISRDVPVWVKTAVSEIAATFDGKLIEPDIALAGEVGEEHLMAAAVNESADNKELVWKISDTEVVELQAAEGGGYKLVFKSAGTATLSISAADGQGASISVNITVTKPKEPEKPEEPVDPVDPPVDPVDPPVDPVDPPVDPVDPPVDPVDPPVDPVDPPVDPVDPPVDPDVPEQPEEVKVESIKVHIDRFEGEIGDKVMLTVVVEPENATNKSIVWSSSDGDVAQVSASGEITLLAPGEAIITGTSTDGSGITVSVKVTVSDPDSAIGAVEGSRPGVSVENRCLIVTGLQPGEPVEIYSISGALVERRRSEGTTLMFEPGARGVYIVSTPRGVYKVGL